MTKMLRHLLLLALLCVASLATAQGERRYTLGETIDIEFTTVGADGAPATLTSTPAVAVFRGSGTTALTSGVTLTVDAGSVTGLNKVRILTSDSSFLPDVDYSVRLTAGATDVSLVGATVGRFRLAAVPDQSGLSTAERLLHGLSVTGGIGDSYMSSVAAWRGVMDWMIADGRIAMRGENVLIDGMNPFSTKGGAAQPGIRVATAAGATFPGTSVVNRQYYSAESTWSGSLASGNAFTPGNFGNDIAANGGGYLDPNLLPNDIGAIDAFISYIGTSNSVTSIRNRIRRGVSAGVVDAPAFNPSSATGYAANHYTLTSMGGSSGSIDMIAQLQATMTSKVWIQLGYGAVALDRTVGTVYGSVIGQGGAGVSHFSSSATPASGVSYTDDQIDAWFEAQAVTGYPVDTLIVHLGINNGDGENITADYLTLLDRWITIGQRHTTQRFGVLAVTPAPYITSGVDKTTSATTKRDQIAAAVEAYGDPTRVQLIDVAQKMIDHHGSVMDWGPTYLVQDGTTYLHPSAAGGPAFGAAFYSALQDAANDIQPAVRTAVNGLGIPAASVTAINADATQTTARTNAASAATQATTAATDTGTLTSRLTAPRAAKLDSLLDSGSVASSTDVAGVTPTPVYARVIHDARVWQYDDRSRSRPVDIVTVKPGFVGRLAFAPALNDGAAVATVTSVTLNDSATGISELGPSGDYSQATFKTAALAAGVYEARAVITTTDGETLPLAATLRVE